MCPCEYNCDRALRRRGGESIRIRRKTLKETTLEKERKKKNLSSEDRILPKTDEKNDLKNTKKKPSRSETRPFLFMPYLYLYPVVSLPRDWWSYDQKFARCDVGNVWLWRLEGFGRRRTLADKDQGSKITPLQPPGGEETITLVDVDVGGILRHHHHHSPPG